MRSASSLGRRFLTWRFLVRGAGGMVGVYLLPNLVLLAFEERIIYHPVRAARHWSEPPTGMVCHDVELQSADGTCIHGRWFPCAAAKGAVLVCHGQAGNVSLECGPRFLAGWHGILGVSVLIFDYPGYGRSSGSPSEAGCYAAADAAYDWLIDTQQVPAESVLLFGQSLGSGVAVDLASRRAHRALILVSPYTSLPDVAVRRFGLLPAPLFMRNRFPSRAKIADCKQPTFILHGTRDPVVPFALGQALFDAAHEPKRFLAVEASHHGRELLNARFFEEVRDFLDAVEAALTSRATSAGEFKPRREEVF